MPNLDKYIQTWVSETTIIIRNIVLTPRKFPPQLVPAPTPEAIADLMFFTIDDFAYSRISHK